MTVLQLRPSQPAGDTSSTIELIVPGLPAPQGSKTIGKWGGLRESSPHVLPWRQAVIVASMQAYKNPPITQAVSISIAFSFPRPKSHYGTGRNSTKLKPSAPFWCTSAGKGDLDKLARATADGLSRSCGGVCLEDDRLIAQLNCKKSYAGLNEFVGAIISINMLV